MDAKEKAKELVHKFSNYVSGWTSTNVPWETPTAQFEGIGMQEGRAKQCALIVVDEILLDKQVGYSKDIIEEKKYWQSVKEEIQKL